MRRPAASDSRMIRSFVSLPVLICLNSCVTERTVTDGSGTVIYQDTEMHTPFESEEKRRSEVMARERELGWQ